MVRAHRLLVIVSAILVLPALTAARVQAQAGRREFGSIVIRVVPPQAEVLIDGERWAGPETDGRLIVQLPPGRHHIELRSPGYRVYESDVEVRAGESTPLNVSLVGAPRDHVPPAPGVPPPFPPQTAGRIHQVSDTGEESGFAISPDYRIADVNHRTAQLLGAYGGVVYAGRLFVGAGGYWQLNYSRNDTRIAYGGAVFEWRQWSQKPLGIVAHALVGGGDARIGSAFYRVARPQPYDGGYRDGYYDLHQGFFVFEPEVQVTARLARELHVTAGIGYRLTSTDRRGISATQLQGLSGSISVRFGR